jgi:DNA-directed RNA polymerase specialized sigma24 family protein
MASDQKQKARAELRRAREDYERNFASAQEVRRESFERAQKAGLSLREIAEEVGLHHTRVREILRGE